MAEYAIELGDIVMEFDGVRALDKVNFNLKKGEIRGLVGKNGAGKSTLMKVIQGVYTQTSGKLFFDGNEIPHTMSIRQREKMVSMIFQEYSLAEELTVAQNIFLNFEPTKNGLIDDAACVKKVKEFFNDLGITIDPSTKVRNLSTGDMQLVEIAKAIIRNTSVILMDEPTAALDAEATKKFFEFISKLRDKGYSIVISSHHLKDIMATCDSVTVIRDGKVTLNKNIGETSLEQVIASMLGETAYRHQKEKTTKRVDRSAPILSVRDICSKNRNVAVSFDIFPGEIVGFAGLKGSGRTEIFNNLFGIDPVAKGEIVMNGKIVHINSPEKAIQSGIFLIPENRHTQGLSLMHTLYDNMLLPIVSKLAKGILVDDQRGKTLVMDMIRSLSIKTPSMDTKISLLSGGNQQKVVVGKALSSHSRVMLMDDPMYGVDIQAKLEIADAMENFTKEGNAVLFVSSEIEELTEYCNRILIIKDNRITEEYEDASQFTEDGLMTAIQ
jgi:ABC-type sugar transport system, ATPase component